MTKRHRARPITDEQWSRIVARRRAREHVRDVKALSRADILKLNPVGAEIRYLRRELAKWRGHCRCVQGQGATSNR